MKPSILSKRVVVYGGGMAGAILAKSLSSITDVTLVDPLDYFEVPMAAPRNLVKPDFAERSIVPFAEALPKVRHIHGKLVELSPRGGRIATVSGEELLLKAEVTVLATGSHFANNLMRGTEGAEAGRKAFYARYSERIDAARNIVIVGGGPIGVEVAGEIAEVHGSGKHVTILEAGPRILAGTTVEMAAHVTGMLRDRGVSVLVGEKLVNGSNDPSDAFAPGGVAVTANGQRIAYDLMIWCTGGRSNTDYMRTHFSSLLNAQGRVRVTPELRVVGLPSIYALGDITDLDENKMAWHIAGQVKTALWNIRRTLEGQQDVNGLKKYRPQTGNPSMVVTMGSKAGVAHLKGLGTVKAGWLVSMIKARHMFVPKYRKALGVGT
ncbi:NAD(P)/FAD-dependent oxidoreductase [Paraburkholderia sp. HP33-1]|uniref:NAD(P)/FAD-dependent oxidoreductase n=1 Tax=Paraburkholderia sp. HP33-1 TaxID=2883243 RepID=UPI001F2E96CE|nr:FAD-dependent oxidoreductase [Paraburkholderia sp. HP33-1]